MRRHGEVARLEGQLCGTVVDQRGEEHPHLLGLATNQLDGAHGVATLHARAPLLVVVHALVRVVAEGRGQGALAAIRNAHRQDDVHHHRGGGREGQGDRDPGVLDGVDLGDAAHRGEGPHDVHLRDVRHGGPGGVPLPGGVDQIEGNGRVPGAHGRLGRDKEQPNVVDGACGHGALSVQVAHGVSTCNVGAPRCGSRGVQFVPPQGARPHLVGWHGDADVLLTDAHTGGEMVVQRDLLPCLGDRRRCHDDRRGRSVHVEQTHRVDLGPRLAALSVQRPERDAGVPRVDLRRRRDEEQPHGHRGVLREGECGQITDKHATSHGTVDSSGFIVLGGPPEATIHEAGMHLCALLTVGRARRRQGVRDADQLARDRAGGREDDRCGKTHVGHGRVRLQRKVSVQGREVSNHHNGLGDASRDGGGHVRSLKGRVVAEGSHMGGLRGEEKEHGLRADFVEPCVQLTHVRQLHLPAGFGPSNVVAHAPFHTPVDLPDVHRHTLSTDRRTGRTNAEVHDDGDGRQHGRGVGGNHQSGRVPVTQQDDGWHHHQVSKILGTKSERNLGISKDVRGWGEPHVHVHPCGQPVQVAAEVTQPGWASGIAGDPAAIRRIAPPYASADRAGGDRQLLGSARIATGGQLVVHHQRDPWLDPGGTDMHGHHRQRGPNNDHGSVASRRETFGPQNELAFP
mmetsp:Transcript_14547/g.25828  ORF Transcript_14547/g.25828 Transcript_14547/m.25828 type:complete len:682 (-) Transcript_14547:5183-7228(-)